MAQVTQEELHTLSNDPSTLNIASGVELTETQRRHVAVVLDLFQGKGSMSKIKDNFSEEGVYEDEFAKSGGIKEVGESFRFAPASSFQLRVVTSRSAH